MFHFQYLIKYCLVEDLGENHEIFSFINISRNINNKAIFPISVMLMLYTVKLSRNNYSVNT